MLISFTSDRNQQSDPDNEAEFMDLSGSDLVDEVVDLRQSLDDLNLDQCPLNLPKQKYEDPPNSTVIQTKLCHITSSYESEVLAQQGALILAEDEELENEKVAILSDSLSFLSQLHALPTKPKLVHAMVADVVSRIVHLTQQQQNRLEFFFIPSHEDIGYSEVVDERAKQACTVGDDIDHDPILSSYKLLLKQREKQNLERYL